MADGKRVCKRCNEAKVTDDFATYNRGGEKLRLRTCKGCHREQERERQRRYVEANREAHNRRSRENKRTRYQKDPDFRAEMVLRSKRYYEENKDRILEDRGRHYEETKSAFQPRFVRTPCPWEEFDES